MGEFTKLETGLSCKLIRALFQEIANVWNGRALDGQASSKKIPSIAASRYDQYSAKTDCGDFVKNA
jgi:hypothetical protein